MFSVCFWFAWNGNTLISTGTNKTVSALPVPASQQLKQAVADLYLPLIQLRVQLMKWRGSGNQQDETEGRDAHRLWVNINSVYHFGMPVTSSCLPSSYVMTISQQNVEIAAMQPATISAVEDNYYPFSIYKAIKQQTNKLVFTQKLHKQFNDDYYIRNR